MSKSSGPELFGALCAVMNAVGSTLILVLMGIVLTDVVGRSFFGSPLPGTLELAAVSIAAIVFLQFPHTLRAGRVISTDSFLAWLGTRSPAWEQRLLGIYHLVGAALFLVVSAALVPLLQRTIKTHDFFGLVGTFTFPKWPVHALILFGCIVMALQYGLLAWSFFRAAGRGERLYADLDPGVRVIS